VRTGLRFATLYAAGHAVVVFAIGLLAIAAGKKLPDSVDEVMARIVGATLILLGIYVFYALLRYGKDFRMRSRWMLIFQTVRNVIERARTRIGRPSEIVEHEHAHVSDASFSHHDQNGGSSVATRTHTHLHSHTDPFMNYGTGTSFAVGMLHGIGGETPTQVILFLTVAGVGGAGAGIVVLSAFLVGLLTSNSVLAMLSASGYLAAAKRFTIYATVSVVTAVASLSVGALFLLGKSAWLPAFFGG
jgi:hypothetical protein